ncbi:growth/differentiation factor 8 [Pholidichthys leucotaenia]
MVRSHTPLQFLSWMLLLLVLTLGRSPPHMAQGATSTMGKMDSQKALLLEAVKTGILSSLSMDREPQPTQKASEQELRRMYQLYRETWREMRRNSSQPVKETQQPTWSTVLFPVEPQKMLRGPQSGQRMQRYRVVFQKNSHIQTKLTIARAELRISRKILHKLTPGQSSVRKEVRVKVNGMRPLIPASWMHTGSAGNTNTSKLLDVIVDIRLEVEKWIRSDGQNLTVDVAILNREGLELKPTISLELGLAQPKRSENTRQRRSNKEDICDERGWCCRQSVIVSFKDIGWSDWVVAPAEYTMHFCDGTCPHNYKPASMHTQVKSRLHQITRGGTPRPCCVPAEYEPMVLMHYDSRGKLKLTPFSDLIVSKCYCA